MRTNIELDEELVRAAFEVTRARTKRELVHLALQELVRSRRKKDLTDLAGRMTLRKGFNHKRLRQLRRDPR